ncbi:MAG: hypothetical protein JRJ37_06135, partial [Deltaproteobacteria bacterium]|nr:hypothetical protein [Deltaproteobacteria bacterium]
MKKLTMVILATMMSFIPILTVCHADAKGVDCPTKEARSAQLFITLPTEYNTPDGAALDLNGNIILSMPNFNNDHLIETGKIKE